ncbi:MAG: sensor domain-containing diguanylate cyclase [Armatimonadota bacterium]|nr:sensor domain-containing diguanylate cyclase [Armatimonadota bacterium]
MRAVILLTAAVTAGLSVMNYGELAAGLALVLGGSLYVLFTALAGLLERADSPHHTAVTAGDIILITAIVWLTGGVHSEYYLLYYLPVLSAGLRLNVRDGIAASVLAGALYVFVAFARESRPLVLTSPLARVLAVCVSAIVLVVFFALLKREVLLCNSLSDTLHTSLGRVAAIYGIAHAANTRAGLAPVLSIFLDHAARITHAANGWILLLSPQGQLKPMASLSSPPSAADRTIEFPHAPAQRAASEGSPIVLTPEEQTSHSDAAEARTFVYVPLKTSAETIGVCVLASRTGRKFNRAHLDFLESIGAEAALAIENARLRAELRRLAVTDYLTDLPSRREVERRLLTELARSRRHQRPLALLMIDVDNLKSINDKLGHAAGDTLLHALGKLLQAQVRAADAPGRIGGDEFLVVLPDTDPQQAKLLADRLIQAFSQQFADRQVLRISPNLRAAVGISIGIAAVPSGRASAKQLMARADSALYQAKRAGKNRSCLAEEIPEPTAAHEPEQQPLAL